MAKEKIAIKNSTNDPLNKLLNKVNIVKNESNLDEIFEEIAEICSETNEEFSVNPKQNPAK